MAKPRFQSLPPPTAEEMDAALRNDRGVTAFSATNTDQNFFLKLRCGNGDEAVIWFDATRADDLLRHLEKILIGKASSESSRSKMVHELPASYGRVHPASARGSR
jgi:hypothetical protein